METLSSYLESRPYAKNVIFETNLRSHGNTYFHLPRGQEINLTGILSKNQLLVYAVS